MQDQWRKKKQTKEEAAAARRAKLDPDSVKSAKDVMDERARKRKLDEADDLDIEGVEKELPKQGMKIAEQKNKKQKTEIEFSNKEQSATKSTQIKSINEDDTNKKAKVEQRKLKQQQKKEKLVKAAEKKKAKKNKAATESTGPKDAQGNLDMQESAADEDEADDGLEADEENSHGDELEKIEVDGLADEEPALKSTASPSPAPSPIFDSTAQPSANTSTSSTIPPATAPKHIKIPTDPELLKARLAARIEALRAARKADGPNGAPAKNRQELMEARRKKEEQRRAHKKELRYKAMAEEEARREEALASARDSPASGMMSPALHTANESFSFGRVLFADGEQLADDLSGLLKVPKKKGSQDPATALQATEKKRLRLAGLDDEKRADIEEKEMWLSAKKRAHGEKVRDDTSLLKKTLKRKEKAKKKSEKEWSERKEGVAKAQHMKQKKREENLRKRKEEKGGKGKGKSGGPKKGAKKSRPGFEGSFGTGKRK